MARNPLTQSDIEFIKTNCLNLTDKQISEKLKRDIRTITSWRKKLGVQKGQKGVVIEELPKKQRLGYKMTEKDRVEFFKTQLMNNTYYTMLKKQFTKEEIDFYLEEWGTLCLQFEDILATEKRQIDELIKAAIMGNRILRNIKISEEEIEKLQDEVDELRKKKDVVNDDEAQERDTVLISMIRTMATQSEQMSEEYQKNVNLRNRILDELKGRRKDRIEQLKKSNTTFLGLVSALREHDLREKQGRHSELLRLAKEKKKEEWRKPNIFPDNSRDCILVDAKSELPQKNISVINDTVSNIVNKYNSFTNAKILIIDDDTERVQFFQTVFNRHDLTFASNVDKAKGYLKDKQFDLVCFDYDLGMNQKGDEAALYLIENNLLPNCDCLVHSMNPDGAKLIESILTDKRYTEVVSYADLLTIIRR